MDPTIFRVGDAMAPGWRKRIRTYHTIVNGRQHLHPSRKSEESMGIWKNDRYKTRPRWSFAFGLCSKSARRCIRGYFPGRGQIQSLSRDTQITEYAQCAHWIVCKIRPEPIRRVGPCPACDNMPDWWTYSTGQQCLIDLQYLSMSHSNQPHPIQPSDPMQASPNQHFQTRSPVFNHIQS